MCHSQSSDDDGESSAHAAQSSDDEDDGLSTGNASTSSSIRGRTHFITPRVVEALDNAKVTDGMAVHIIAAIAEALGHSIADLVISRSSLRLVRLKNRHEKAKKIHADTIEEVIRLV